MSFESGLERGMPWGRDLFTFVTSAAGHMMRTLQKPRKNKPSKRQVNHRRFLHNMIQRKFAEAGTHQLGSALFSTDTSHSQLNTKSSQKMVPTNTMKNATVALSEMETPAKQQNVVNDTRTSDCLVDNNNACCSNSTSPKNGNNSLNSEKDKVKSLNSGIVNSVVGNSREELENIQESSSLESIAFDSERELFQSASVDLDNLLQVSNIILEDNIVTWLENFERLQQNSNVPIPKSPDEEQEHHLLEMTLFDKSPTLPAASPFSLDSCDIEGQLQTDSDHISQLEQIAQSLQMDVMQNDSAVHTQSEEDQGCFQNNFTVLNTSYTGCLMDIQPDSSEDLDVGPQFAMLLQNSNKDLSTEQDLIGNVCNRAACGSGCGSGCHHSQSMYMAKQSEVVIDTNLTNSEMHTAINKEVQYTSSMTEEISKALEPGHFLNHFLDRQALQSTEHVHANQALTQNWEQLVHKAHTPGTATDPYCVLLDENNSINSETTLNPNSVYTRPPDLYSSSVGDLCCFGMPLPASGNCKEDSCLYSNSEGGQSISSFEGVAESFLAPAHKPHPHPISTPPLNDDWLFSNIMAEENFKSTIKSPANIYC